MHFHPRDNATLPQSSVEPAREHDLRLRQTTPGIRRRDILFGLAAASFTARARAETPPLRIEALFAGNIDDHGFMQAGYQGLLQARDGLGASIGYIDGVKPEKALLAAALHQLAERGPVLVIAHGGQNNDAAVEVAAAFPAMRFAVTQGGVAGPNLASYEVLQDQSAFLAGVFAAATTRTRIVGHMSGIRVKPGLTGRAAYLAGVAHADRNVRVLTNFSGNQDDPVRAHRIAKAMIDAGADVIFTMLNTGRDGVTQACRENGVAQIGNVGDWTKVVPDVFAASAVADVSLAVFNAAKDVADGTFATGTIRRIGLENPGAVRLAMRSDVPDVAREKVQAAASAVLSGAIRIPDTWESTEFEPPG